MEERPGEGQQQEEAFSSQRVPATRRAGGESLVSHGGGAEGCLGVCCEGARPFLSPEGSGVTAG